MALHLGAPQELLDMADFVATTCYKTHKRDLMNFDVFSGERSIESAFRACGHKTEYFDIASRPVENNIATTRGFAQAVLGTLRLLPGALLTLGPPCGSYVFLNRATSGRSQQFPYGFEDRPYVELASLICSRALLLVVLATARGVFVALEQPASSTMKFFPDLVRTGKLIKKHLGADYWDEQFFWMGTWGASTAKPSRLWGSASGAQQEILHSNSIATALLS
ncbi:unnamed protein product [Effrenium voratum]|nr:unnamed protein product [Effrenium voratum]